MTLDVATIATVRDVLSVELSLVVLLVGRLLRGQAGVRPLVLATASFTAGGLALGLREHVPEPIPALVGVALLYLGPALAWVGARDLLRTTALDEARVGGLVAVLALAVAMPQRRGDELASSIAAVVWSAAIVWTLLRHAPRPQRSGARVAAALVVVYGAFHLARALFPLEVVWRGAAVSLASIFFGIAWVFVVISLMSQQILTRLRGAARTDGLTGLLNRRALHEDGSRVLELCRRQSKAVALLLIDLDRFKLLNDTHGHAAGDLALRHFASIASSSATPGSLVGRYGGEEFCLVIPGASRVRARKLAHQLRAQLAATPARDGTRPLSFTVSVGVAFAAGPDLELDRLIAQADDALYRAKNEGRDRVLEAVA